MAPSCQALGMATRLTVAAQGAGALQLWPRCQQGSLSASRVTRRTSLKLPHEAALGSHSARRRSTSIIIEISLRPGWSGEVSQGQSRSPGLQWVSRRQGGEDGAIRGRLGIRDGMHRLYLKCFVLNCLAHSPAPPPPSISGGPAHQQTSEIPQ